MLSSVIHANQPYNIAQISRTRILHKQEAIRADNSKNKLKRYAIGAAIVGLSVGGGYYFLRSNLVEEIGTIDEVTPEIVNRLAKQIDQLKKQIEEIKEGEPNFLSLGWFKKGGIWIRDMAIFSTAFSLLSYTGTTAYECTFGQRDVDWFIKHRAPLFVLIERMQYCIHEYVETKDQIQRDYYRASFEVLYNQFISQLEEFIGYVLLWFETIPQDASNHWFLRLIPEQLICITEKLSNQITQCIAQSDQESIAQIDEHLDRMHQRLEAVITHIKEGPTAT